MVTTPKLGINKPVPDVEEDWGFRWNENADVLDDAVLTANLTDGGNVVITDDGSGNVAISGARNLLASIPIDTPTASEDASIMRMQSNTTIQAMYAVIRPTSTSVTWTIRHDADRNATGLEVVTGGTTTSDINAGDTITVMNNPTITGGSWVWLETTAITSTPQELIVQLFA